MSELLFEYKVRARHRLGWKEFSFYATTDIEEFLNRNSIDYVRNATDTVENRLFKEIERLNNIINKLKWKPIEEYDKGNYDWVLVKYFDGDYECVPCVAEKRFGKWHSIDEKEIQFDVKYFMDMQQIDKLQELKGGISNDN